MIASLDSGSVFKLLPASTTRAVVVVDDGGNTPPKDVVALFWSELDVTVVTQPHAGPATARNTGAVNARGRFLVFTDDDCRPAPSWLHALEARFAETPDSLVGGSSMRYRTTDTR